MNTEESPSQAIESKVISITLLTPLQIKNTLILEAANGWELCSVGTNFAFLQRERVTALPDLAYQIESITLSLPHQILQLLQAHGAKGWALAGMGASYAFFKRARNLPASRREYAMDSVTVRGIRAIRQLVDARAAEGWALCAVGRNFAFFERPANDTKRQTPVWEHKDISTRALSITLKTPREIQSLLDTEGQQGWRLCAVGASFLFLRKELRAPGE
jgi:hypothetical protein